MNPNPFLFWFVGFATLLLLFRSWRARPRLWGWLGLSVVVLLGMGVGWLLVPEASGYVAVGIWGPAILLPMICRVLAQRALNRRSYRTAAWYARAMAVLHPFDDWPALAMLIVGLDQAQRGLFETAKATYASLVNRPLAGWQARIYKLALEQDWEAIALMGPSLPPGGQGIVMRALGEIGMREEMIQRFAAMGGQRAERPAEYRMILAAFCGRPDIVRRLHGTALLRMDEPNKRYWLATAEQVAGNPERANAVFLELTEGEDRILAELSERRIEEPLEPVPLEFEEELEADLRRTLRATWSTTRRDDGLATLTRPVGRNPWGTWALMAILAGWFTAQAFNGGVDNTTTLMTMGAMRAPAEILHGEYWRLATAGWLHFGWAHWVVNVFGLWIFGRFIEAGLGRWRMLVVYVLSGLAAMATWMWLTWDAPNAQAVVGASASVMGLVGAALVILLRRWRLKLGGRRTRLELGFIVIMVVLQVAFDLSVPQSSFTGHAAGFAWGVVLALLVSLLRRRSV